MPYGLPIIKGRIFSTEPERGDVVVFKLPGEEHVNYVKRLIGLPGDRIQVKHSHLHINGKATELERIDDYIRTNENGSITRSPQYIETLPQWRVLYYS